MPELSEYEAKAIESFEKSIFEGKWDNDGLVQLIELVGTYLNIKSIPDYAKQYKLSYNGVKKTRTIRKIFNHKFVIDKN